jgi:hypothetical protein
VLNKQDNSLLLRKYMFTDLYYWVYNILLEHKHSLSYKMRVRFN